MNPRAGRVCAYKNEELTEILLPWTGCQCVRETSSTRLYQLRKLAAAKLAHEKPGQTLDATALVHEAYVRVGGEQPQDWNGRGHFFAAAAEAMRRILVDNARRKQSLKHGGVGGARPRRRRPSP